MTLTPEAQILILNATIAATAFFGIYPSLRVITLDKIMICDLVTSTLALLAAGGLFWGSGVPFNMILFQANWAVFTIVTMAMIEIPLLIWFCRKHGLSLFDDD